MVLWKATTTTKIKIDTSSSQHLHHNDDQQPPVTLAAAAINAAIFYLILCVFLFFFRFLFEIKYIQFKSHIINKVMKRITFIYTFVTFRCNLYKIIIADVFNRK